MGRPLLVAFLAFIAGILSASSVSIKFTAALLLILFSLVLISAVRKRFDIVFNMLICILVFIIGFTFYINFNTISSKDISCVGPAMTRECYVKGTIVSSPEYKWARWNTRKASFTLKVSAIKKEGRWIKTGGLSRVKIRDNKKDYYYGQKMLILGELEAPPAAKNPGEFDYARYLMRQSIYTIIDARSDDDVTLEAAEEVLSVKKIIFDVRENMQQLIDRNLPVQDAAILSAMLIGNCYGITKDLMRKFVETGTAHILSVSGLHTSLLASIIFLIFRLIRIPRKISAILLIGFLFLYVILTGARSPIVRSAIMTGAYLFSYIFERRFDIYSALSLAGIFILLINPAEIFNVGFVLSFSCVFSLCYFTPKHKNLFLKLFGARIDIESIGKNRFVRYVSELAIVSLAVYIGVAPLIAYYFNIIAPVTIVANIFAVPLLGLALFLGVIFVTAGSIVTPLAVLLSYPLHAMLLIFLKTLDFFSSIKYGHFYIRGISLYVVTGYYIFILFVSNMRQAKKLLRIV